MKKMFFYFTMTGLILMLTGCMSAYDGVLKTSSSQVHIRNYQSRSFDTEDRMFLLRGIISTMQDLGFIVDKADKTLGVVSGTSFKNGSKLTVSVRPTSGGKQFIVRANAQKDLRAIDDPRPYQNFFNALSQSLFLDANMVD